MTFTIDGTLYPDAPPPEELRTVADRVDYIARLCAAWDFGLLPDAEVVDEIRRPNWRHAIDRCDLLTSPTFHLLRKWHKLPARPFLGSIPAYIRDDPCLALI